MRPSALELVYDYFEDHVRLAAYVRESRPLAVGVMGFLLGGLSLFVAQALANRLMVLSFSWTSLAMVLSWKVLAGFLLASILHLILSLQNEKGDAVSLFILFGLADLVWTTTVPLILIVRAFSQSALPITAVFMGVGFLALSLKARSLQDGYGISSGKAWFTLGLPYLAVAGAVLLSVGLLVFKAVMSATSLFN